MASSHEKATHLSPQPFYNYLNRLQEEFDRRSSDTSSPRRFNIYLGNLKGEFELLSLEIESLKKERDEYRAKAEEQVKKVQDARCHFVCERCGLGTTSAPQTDGYRENVDVRRKFVCERCSTGPSSAPQIAAPSKPKTTASLFSKPFFRLESLDKLSISDKSNGVDVTQETTAGRSTQHMTLIQKLHSAITPTRPSQSIFPAMTKCSETIVTDSQAAGHPATLPQTAAPTVEPDSGTVRDLSIEFNHGVEKELDVEIENILYHGNRISCVKFSWDGKYVAAGCSDGRAYIYDVQAGTPTRVLKNLLAEEDHIRAVCFSHDGKYLATGSWDGKLYIWEITKKFVRNAFKGHTRHIMSLDFSPNGRLLVSASDDNTVRLWNMHDGAARFLTDDNPTSSRSLCYTSAVFSPNGRFVAASHRDGIVRIWDVCTGHLTRRMKNTEAYDVVFMPDGKGLVTGSWDNKLKYWDVSSLDSTRFRARSSTKDPRREAPEVEEQPRPDREFSGHKGPVYSVSISPDGRWVASGSFDRCLRIWDSRKAATRCSVERECDGEDWVHSVDFSPAGRYLATGGESGELRILRYSNVATADS